MLVCTAMRSKTSPIRCGGDVSLPPTFQALTAIRLRAISSIGDIMLDSVHQGRSGMTIKRVDRFGQHQLFVVCVRYVQDWPGLLRFATGCGGRSGWSPKVVIAASTVPAAGSKACGSPIRSTRQTASPGTTAQAMRARAQQTETLCSAEKPSVPKKSRPRRSRISPRQPIRCPSVYSVNVSALDASMSPRALMTASDDLSRRLANRAVRPCHGWERKPPSGSTDAEVVMGHRVRVGDRCIPGSTTPAWAAQGCRTTAVRGADGAFMVIPDVRLSPVCSA